MICENTYTLAYIFKNWRIRLEMLFYTTQILSVAMTFTYQGLLSTGFQLNISKYYDFLQNVYLLKSVSPGTPLHNLGSAAKNTKVIHNFVK